MLRWKNMLRLFKQQQPHSFWQRYRASKNAQTGTILVILILLILLVSPFFIKLYPQHHQEDEKPETMVNATVNSIVAQVLIDENTNGWDSKYHGILINWRRDDLTKVNCSPTQCDVRGQSTRHDGMNDLRDLENLYWYKYRHPGDSSMDQYIARILPTVKQEWENTTLAKGWIYYLLLRLATYSNDANYWNQMAEHWAQVQYQTIDTRLGLHHGPVDTVAGPGSVRLQDAYRVDLDLEIGTALVDAGTRYHHAEWIAAGQREVSTVIRETFSTTYHLFSRIYLVYDPKYGANKIIDYQARMGEAGQEIEALIRTGAYTHTHSYLALAQEMIDALQSLALHDRVYGGFNLKIYLGPYRKHQAGQIDSSLKEARQLHVLGAVHLANRVFNNKWAAIENEMLHLATTPHKLFLPAPAPGFTYGLQRNWALHPCQTCSPNPTENWDSAEADNIALEALQSVLSA